MHARKLLPPNLRSELNITEISFNVVASSFIEPFLKRLIKNRLSQMQVKKMAQSCQGDIRTALNRIRWNLWSLDKAEQRDTGLSLFHGIGKILNAKRLQNADTDRKDLPLFFSDNFARHLLVEQLPEKVVEMCELDSTQFVNFLHENAIDFYRDIEAAANALEFISLGDRVNEWTFNAGADYAVSLACRGYIFSSPCVVKAWRPIRKPQFDFQSRRHKNEVITVLTNCILSRFSIT